MSEAVSFGDDETDALARGAEALAVIFSGRIDDRVPIPMPSALKGRPGVVLPAGVSAKILLWNAMLAAGLRKADLARRLGMSPTLVDRLLDLHHSSRIEQIEAALAALGQRLVVDVRAA